MDGPVTNKQKIVERLAANGAAFRGVGVRRLGLFGSFLHDRPTEASDVDLLVEFDPIQKNFDNYWQLSLLLEDALRHPVDLLTTEGLSPYIGPRILAEVEYVSLSE